MTDFDRIFLKRGNKFWILILAVFVEQRMASLICTFFVFPFYLHKTLAASLQFVRLKDTIKQHSVPSCP